MCLISEPVTTTTKCCRMLSQHSSLLSKSMTPFTNRLIKVTGLGTQLPGHKLTCPASHLHNVKASVQSGTAQHLPDSKITPYSSVLQWLAWVLVSYRAQAPGRCSQDQLPCSSFTIHTQQQILTFVFHFVTPKEVGLHRSVLFHTKL